MRGRGTEEQKLMYQYVEWVRGRDTLCKQSFQRGEVHTRLWFRRNEVSGGVEACGAGGKRLSDIWVNDCVRRHWLHSCGHQECETPCVQSKSVFQRRTDTARIFS